MFSLGNTGEIKQNFGMINLKFTNSFDHETDGAGSIIADMEPLQ